MFGLGLLRWVRESVLSSKAPHREKVKFVLDGDEDGKGKGKKGDACLNLSMTKRPDSAKLAFSFLFLSFFPSFFFSLGVSLECCVSARIWQGAGTAFLTFGGCDWQIIWRQIRKRINVRSEKCINRTRSKKGRGRIAWVGESEICG